MADELNADERDEPDPPMDHDGLRVLVLMALSLDAPAVQLAVHEADAVLEEWRSTLATLDAERKFSRSLVEALEALTDASEPWTRICENPHYYDQTAGSIYTETLAERCGECNGCRLDQARGEAFHVLNPLPALAADPAPREEGR